MGRITGLEDFADIPPKVLKMYQAVIELIEEGADVGSLRVSTITDRAGIGKGTAYEYFDTKEEIVACALVYYIQETFGWLGKELLKRESFGEQMCYLMDEISQESSRKHCFLRILHILTDNSDFSRQIQQKLSSGEAAKCMPMAVFGKVLGRAVERGELRGDLPMDYMICLVFSHLLAYLLAVLSEPCFQANAERMRPYLYQGVLNELCGKKE
ncbi:MAG: TetR/AcrR family transcriptional regulator [Roseburia sp.]|nr:TetR/AcrR family transcriptional regulator [Roseburia sp.]MCM1098702.1 TetR/AcrR family transcriptional regulator [Ruminococcus flavefaciens]